MSLDLLAWIVPTKSSPLVCRQVIDAPRWRLAPNKDYGLKQTRSRHQAMNMSPATQFLGWKFRRSDKTCKQEFQRTISF
jgi:hypothetical protein